ncbi:MULTISPECIES: hypothetical protein [unclassified Mesorhizobium]|uniref:hypothetical protein n=1 Tax=unclassified Mesorhizobium TaxID=325217 RepID=UPI000FCA5AEF|nr:MULTISPECIES: hypothetical protein [unclassified Mesorhizobium]RWD64275.1 MAG: hypothetical protein EOS36_10355 [Mesorhizobium sp.]RWE38739.1 MAG: hypothetical protein EOS79_22645 [Mesorhizobium sp.]TGP26417.1 hypothetical protein EN874_001700 [Mesorhizobium sp. M1D.F.Ca.ET.231.01.1.1]TGP38375.1 hypothetical protein EN877_01700 [Mesorhizobium sp. M1D.F.Ca.ET.234.01.1.1]TGS50585.1 hypothetical protein EN827_01700 [Mesorhizobium sp. M1D.F.Ca.ET.184.01.1.1]
MTADTEALYDLESLVCDSDDMIDVLADLLENAFRAKSTEGRNVVLTAGEANRLLYIGYKAAEFSLKLRKTFYSKIEAEPLQAVQP